MGCEVQLAAQL